MKKYEQKTYTKREVCSMTCDICKETVNDDSWGEGYYDRTFVTIEMTEGEVYPEGDFRQGYSYDICPDCFRNHIVKLMDSLGAEMTEYDLD